jgi:hypothetical protein
MNTKDVRNPERTPPRKRFRIERLEERIAPKKGGKGTNNCGGSSNTISTSNYY